MREFRMAQAQIKIMADELAIQAIGSSLDKFGLLNICNIEQHDSNDVVVQCCAYNKVFSAPVRMGEILDQVRAYQDKLLKQKSSIIDFGAGKLNTALGVFYLQGGQEVILTEKEIEILVYLYENKDSVISREELLERVWNYAKDVETHTLETHIYRLRQKIEADPTDPQILKTKDNGYSV